MQVNIPANFRVSGHVELASEAAKRAESRQSKQLSDMQEALKRLQAMPSPKALVQQNAANRVAMLKQRLDTLKAMLLHASPEQAKALARELKSIAKELAGAAKSLGFGAGGGGVEVGPNVAADNNAGESSASESGAANSTAAASDVLAANNAGQRVTGWNPAEQNMKADSGDSEQAAASGVASQHQTNAKSSATDEGDQGLRAALLEAKKVLKEVLAMLKAKLANAGKETKRDLQDIDKSLTEISRALAQGGGLELYTGQGELSVGIAVSGVAEGVAGGNVNLSV